MTNSNNLKLILFLLLMLILLSIILILHLYFKNFNSNNIILASYNQDINAENSDVINWFYDLEDYPDRYKFDTHEEYILLTMILFHHLVVMVQNFIQKKDFYFLG